MAIRLLGAGDDVSPTWLADEGSTGPLSNTIAFDNKKTGATMPFPKGTLL